MTIGTALAWSVTVGLLVALLGALAWMVLRRRPSTSWHDDNSEGFSLDRYQPMARLLDEEDLLFLKSQPGYRPEMGVRWKRERFRIFRLYLRELKSDFRRLHAQAREMVSHSEADSPDLVRILMKQQMTFWRVTTALEFRLVLQQLGIGKANVTSFIERIEAMRADLALRTAPLTAQRAAQLMA